MSEKPNKPGLLSIAAELNTLQNQFNILNGIAQHQSESKLLEFMDLKDKTIYKIEEILNGNPDVLNFEPNLKEDFVNLLSDAKSIPSYENGKIVVGPKCYEMGIKFEEYRVKIQTKGFEGVSFD